MISDLVSNVDSRKHSKHENESIVFDTQKKWNSIVCNNVLMDYLDKVYVNEINHCQ